MDEARILRLLQVMDESYDEVERATVEELGLESALEEAEALGLVDTDHEWVYLTGYGVYLLKNPNE